jgi:spermidine synthase
MELWLTEKLELENGSGLTIKVKEHLHSEQTGFQKIEVFDTEMFGRLLLLDGIIMCTEKDEFSYHEMIVHVPMQAHPAPKKALVIGGGDGGSVRELAKYDLEAIHLCEIDRRVVEISREYFSSMPSKLDDPRVTIFYEDGYEFLRNNRNSYDVIIVDSTDPIGPGEALFTQEFYRLVKESLTEYGIVTSQAESIFYHEKIIEKIIRERKEIFDRVHYYFTLVPSYPSGMIGFVFSSLQTDPFTHLQRERTEKLGECRYYSYDMHRAVFTLPVFAQKFAAV